MIAELVELFQVPWRAVLRDDYVQFTKEKVDRLLQVLDKPATAPEREHTEAQYLLATLTGPNTVFTKHARLDLIDEGLMDALSSAHRFDYQRDIKALLFSEDRTLQAQHRDTWERYVTSCMEAFALWGERVRPFFRNDMDVLRIIENAPQVCRFVLQAYRHVGVLAHPPFLTRGLFEDVVIHLDEVKVGLREVSNHIESAARMDGRRSSQ